MRMLDLFSGIGGFSLAAQWVWGDELEIVSFVEIDPYCQKVLKKHWPDVPIIGDVRDVRSPFTNGKFMGWTERARKDIQSQKQESISENIGNFCTERIDLLTGGFPCQSFSVAGKRKGKEDNRFLWPEMFRIVQEFKPRWIVAENVAGIVRMALDDCLSDLEGEGYATGTVIIPACAVNAPHRRDRVWIVANSMRGREKSWPKWGTFSCKGIWNKGADFKNDGTNWKDRKIGRGSNVGNSASQGLQDGRNGETGESRQIKKSERPDWWSVEPDVGRVAHGVSSRIHRLKSLGNAIVPQVAYQIMRAIKEIEDKLCQ